ncbi:MAG: AzlC family ABC transporter permease, partial [Desulfofustis sp.]|nr:AzlC family ABC transporter permease [Desulfofustis sp.]
MVFSSSQRQDLREGFIANLVVAASVAAYGSVLGLMAAQKGLTWYQLLIMNLSVFAGSAQFVMVDMWLPPLPVVEIILAVLVINMRYLLIGAS